MIAVLHDWEEIGRARRALTRRGLPGHLVPEKHWDLFLLATLVDGLDRRSAVVDLGCSGCYVLDLLATLGFRRLLGIDLAIPLRDRARLIKRMVDERAVRPPFRVRKRDIVDSGLPDASVDLLTCVSVIEHGVDVDRLAAECRRILRPGGTLFLTTDYWPDQAPAAPTGVTPFGLPWRGFDRAGVEEAISRFAEYGLVLRQPMPVPPANDAVVSWLGQDYTFIALTLTLARPPAA